MPNYKYNKRCAVCNSIFYSTPITQDQFIDLESNPNIKTTFERVTWFAEIESRCDPCSEKTHLKQSG